MTSQVFFFIHDILEEGCSCIRSHDRIGKSQAGIVWEHGEITCVGNGQFKKRKEEDKMQIRKLEKRDRECYIDMAREFYRSDAVLHSIPDTYIEKTVDECLRSDVYAEIYMFECENVCAGYALIAKTFSQEAGGLVCWIEEVYVREAYRSKGLGRTFFSYIRKKYGDRISRFRLEVEEENERACSLYKKLGYTPLNYKQMVLENEKK